MPATIVGTEMIATQALIFRMSSFCRTLTWARFAETNVVSRPSNSATWSVT